MKFKKPTEALLRPAVAPIEPTPWALRRTEALLKIAGPIGRTILGKHIQDIQIQGIENLAKGPKLVLMNHSNPFDPLILTFFGRQLIHFLITEPYMTDRLASRFTAYVGQIPKRKLDPDTRSIRAMKKWCQLGGAVGMFPEGHFPWDGKLLPLQPGLDQLIRYLDVPVVTVRLINSDRLWPAWAKHPRKSKLRLEIDAPRRFSSDQPIMKPIAESLTVDPENCQRFPVQGKNLAEGLAHFIQYCFDCGADQSLDDRGDELKCSQCKKSWTVTTDNRVGEISIGDAWKKVRSALSKKWGKNPTLESRASVTVFDATSLQWTRVDEGILYLQNQVLKAGSWKLELKELQAHTLDWGDLILLRTERKRFAVRMPTESRAVWGHALDLRDSQDLPDSRG
ncbi:MAG: 1-acyl-sn-glycerol-3-phosphate acyltransferase [Bdellovibrionales bacterium]|nr:1-acyl-sn-glycerol-3-phosphate acyltransferase [Bdellovibrionales bacterium]